jgi:tetratricopeptide (TPR) repeat protein
VPGWHEATQALRQQGKLQVVGIIQEQHPDRARLFMQWKRMDWPVLVDSYNLLGTGLVPITLLIDEHGIVRHSAPPASRAGALLETFIHESYDAREVVISGGPASPDLVALEQTAKAASSALAWRDYADALALWGGDEQIDEAIGGYGNALAIAPDNGPAQFRLGVTFRRRYDSERGAPDDFTRAVEHWQRALEIDPNNYIWRRRIQQYGPRLGKPYPFYDWVDRARSDIAGRGAEPVALRVEPRGAELALPSQSFDVGASPPEPDPEGRILRDNGKYVRADATVVPQSVTPGGATRVHLEFRPNPSAGAHWNNEVGGLLVWLQPPEPWEVENRRLALPKRSTPVSDEARRVEFEVKCPEGVTGSVEIPGYALYYVCEGIQGACLYRRQDLLVPVTVRP